MTVGRRYFVDLLASTAMKRVQAESFGGTKGDGFPLATMLSMVSVESKQIVPVLAAHIYTVCPTAIPTLPTPKADASEDDVMIGLGMQRNKKTGEFETFPQFLARTENIVSFMAAIQSSLPSSHQLLGGNIGALLWLKRFIDLLPPAPTSPLPLITAPVLGAFLKGAGHMLANAHTDNFKKLLAIIQSDIMNRLDEGEIGKPSAIRLGKVLEGGFDSFLKNLPLKAVPELYCGASERSQKKEGAISFGGTIGGKEKTVQRKKPQHMQQQQNGFGGRSSFRGSNRNNDSYNNNNRGSNRNDYNNNNNNNNSNSSNNSPFGGGGGGFNTENQQQFQSGTATPAQNPFGGSAPPAPSASPFGGGAPAPSPFGGGAAPSPSPFGGGNTNANPSPFGGGMAPSPSPFGGGGGMAPSPSPFGGGGMAPSPSPFGASNNAISQSPFGDNASSPSPFGGGGNQMQQNSSFGGGNANRQAQPCKFFALGKCTRGSSCKFSHESGGGNSGGNSGFGGGYQSNNSNSNNGGGNSGFGGGYQSNNNNGGGNNGFGGGYQSNNNNRNKNREGFQSKSDGKRGPCSFFAQGRCKKGDNCLFSHDIGGGNAGFQQSNNWNGNGSARRRR
eukprot:CAMPEP_0168164322 /NCGR_PEP_ID=MMETSP0139_2-20121125/873_1 /TAXON_ID=44445 /ORGANISM="Pseudo-nitzschia australis, Strain 10249 10 AB" /LENGTH=613 /DNA_ID=CAMNT_0008081327 /DNA_START=90 /DNA_END=1931 /DNA_ORIENTATION=-